MVILCGESVLEEFLIRDETGCKCKLDGFCQIHEVLWEEISGGGEEMFCDGGPEWWWLDKGGWFVGLF
jgi:hypothetical protein